MAKQHDKAWFLDEHGQRCTAVVTRGQTLVDGIPAPGSYDENTVDLAVHVEVVDERGVAHSMIERGVVGAKRALSVDDQKTPGHWWPR